MTTRYGIIYGEEASPDFQIDAPYDTVDQAREAVDEEAADEWGGAAIIEVTPYDEPTVDADWDPGAHVEEVH